MSVKNFLSLSLVIILFSSTLIGQETFRKGYILKNNGDTLKGLILYEQLKTTPQKIVFKRFEIAQPITYKPGEVLAFGYRDANHFESRFVNGKQIFLECFIKGKLSLWGNGSKIYAEKDGQIVELKDKEVTYNNKTYTKAIDVLDALTIEATSLNYSAYISMIPERLTPLFEDYNRLMESGYVAYYNPFEEKVISKDLISEVKRHSFGIMSSYNINKTHIGAEGMNFTEVPINSYVVNNTSYGLFYNYKFNTVFHDISIQLEVHYKEFEGSYYIETQRKPLNRSYYIDMYSASNDLRVPIALQYTKPFNSFSIFANIGIINNFRLKASKSGILEVDMDGEIVSYSELNPTKYRDFRHKRSYFASLGLRKQITSKINIFAETRAEMLFCNLEKDVDFQTNNTEVLEFVYYSPQITLVRNSPVLSFIIGIGF